MSAAMYLWLIGMWFVGGLIYTVFGLQIAITKNCSYKLLSLLKSSPQNWYPDACEKYWKSVVRKNRIIMWVIAIALSVLIPGIGFIGYLVGIATKWLFTMSQTGPNENNISDCVGIFSRFAKPGLEYEFEDDLYRAISVLSSNRMPK